MHIEGMMMSLNIRNKQIITMEGIETTSETQEDLAVDFEMPISILEDLISIAIEEIGNGTGRAISILLPALRYVDDLKKLHLRLQQKESMKYD